MAQVANCWLQAKEAIVSLAKVAEHLPMFAVWLLSVLSAEKDQKAHRFLPLER